MEVSMLSSVVQIMHAVSRHAGIEQTVAQVYKNNTIIHPQSGKDTDTPNFIIGVKKEFCHFVKPVFYQWIIIVFMISKKIGVMKCTSGLNKVLEEGFRNNLETVKYGKKTYNLKEFVATTEGDERFTYEIYRQVLIAGKIVKLPKYWTPTQSHTCQLFKVDETSEEFKNIASTFNDTIKKKSNGSTDDKNIYTITCIQRIQNLLVYQKYYSYISASALNSNGEIENEKLLFHGTRNIPPGAIISSQEGFDTRLAGNQNLWGPAAYFAEDAEYVHAFAFNNSHTKSKQIIVASVMLGSCFNYGTLCNPSLQQPPINIDSTRRYDSVSGVTKGSRIYAVFNSSRSCPRYIISYVCTTNDEKMENADGIRKN